MESGVDNAEFLDEVFSSEANTAPNFKDTRGIHPPALGSMKRQPEFVGTAAATSSTVYR